MEGKSTEEQIRELLLKLMPPTVHPGPMGCSGEDWVPRFLSAMMRGATVLDATREVGVDISTPYRRRMRDEVFKQAWKEAAEIGTDMLEQEAQRRAFHGVMEQVFYRGVPCGEIRKYSDQLLMFLLKKRDPSYRDSVDSDKKGSFQLNVNIVQVDNREQAERLADESSGQDDRRLREATAVLGERG